MTDSDRTGQSGDGGLVRGHSVRKTGLAQSVASHKKLLSLAIAGLFGVSVAGLAVAGNLPFQHDNASMKHSEQQGAQTDKADPINSKDVSNSSSLDVDVNSSSRSSSDAAENHSSTTVTVNGQTEKVEDSSIDRTYTSDNGSTNVHISVDNNTDTEAGE